MLFHHLAFEWSAFRSLSSDRQVHRHFFVAPLGAMKSVTELGPIPWRSIDHYASRYGIEGDEFDRFCELIQAMDAVYCAHNSKAD